MNPRKIIPLFLALAATAWAQSPLKNPASKLYVADVNGEVQIQNGEKIVDAAKKDVYTGQGTIITTTDKSNYAMVFSNSVGAYFGPTTRAEIRKFKQDPFRPSRTDLETEPSVSDTDVYVSQGLVALCTGSLIPGSTMKYSTPDGSLAIRGKHVVIDVRDNETVISVLDGDTTVRAQGTPDEGGLALKGGQRAILKKKGNGTDSLTIEEIPKTDQDQLWEYASVACSSRKLVYFEVQGVGTSMFDGADSADSTKEKEIVAIPLVPAEVPPANVSPANLTR